MARSVRMMMNTTTYMSVAIMADSTLVRPARMAIMTTTYLAILVMAATVAGSAMKTIMSIATTADFNGVREGSNKCRAHRAPWRSWQALIMSAKVAKKVIYKHSDHGKFIRVWRG